MQKASQLIDDLEKQLGGGSEKDTAERRAYMATSKHSRPCDACGSEVSGWFELEVGHPDIPKRTRICQGCLDAVDRVRVRRVGGVR